MLWDMGGKNARKSAKAVFHHAIWRVYWTYSRYYLDCNLCDTTSLNIMAVYLFANIYMPGECGNNEAVVGL